MDGSAFEHSDSDSGESWTLLDNNPSYADDALGFSENPRHEGDAAYNGDKDEDTDGISIISDSEPESTTPCELSYDRCLVEVTHPTEHPTPNYISTNPIPPNNNTDLVESVSGADLLGDGSGKLKTYVHRRNNRLSTMLNIIVLGSVITAAGVAIGHMWGAKNECSIQTPPSVNKILSNLYKLQEENAYLRNKLKELALVNNLQMQQQKADSDKNPLKQRRCKKVFEESLNNKNAEKLTRCVESDGNKPLDHHLEERDYEKDFINEVDKVKHIYLQNRSWLDEEIARRIKKDEPSETKNKYKLKSPKSVKINEDHITLRDLSLKRQLESTNEKPSNMKTIIKVMELVPPAVLEDIVVVSTENPLSKKKISYADSLKLEHNIKKRNINEESNENKFREQIRKKIPRKQFAFTSENSVSEEEVMKDDRYNYHKFKPERKKNDRYKINKKQKRRNKYEQWEMNGGYMKDYDEFSMTVPENEYTPNDDKNNLSQDFDQNNNVNHFAAVENDKSGEIVEVKANPNTHTKGIGIKDRGTSWYEKRVALRTEARKKLEQELFGESTPSNAGWYFRRMQRREQCRVKGDNSTHRKFSKRIMNFKTKH